MGENWGCSVGEKIWEVIGAAAGGLSLQRKASYMHQRSVVLYVRSMVLPLLRLGWGLLHYTRYSLLLDRDWPEVGLAGL